MTTNDVLYPFRVGSIACTVVNDVDATYEPEEFFGSPPAEELAQALRQHGLDPAGTIPSPYPAVLINTGSHRVLVDAGFDPVSFPPHLQAAGTRPEEIDVVVITHAHADHYGGAITAEGESVYPNARYVMATKEWDFWMAEPRPDKVGMWDDELSSFARARLPLIRDQLELAEPEGELLPGISLVTAPGHTPGQLAVVVSSGTEELLIISDAVLHPIHLEHPDWSSPIDVDPEQAKATARKLFEHAVAHHALVQGSHFPFPGLGSVERDGEAWRWRPISAAPVTPP